MGTILLLSLSEEAERCLRQVSGLPPDAFEHALSPEQAFQRLARQTEGQARIAVLILGAALTAPIQTVQQAYLNDKDLAIRILVSPERRKSLAQALQFAPYIGSDTVCWTDDALAEHGAELNEVGETVGRRRNYHAMTAAVSQRLTGLNRHEVHVVQYLDRLLNSAPIGIVVVDEAGVVRGWNLYATTLLEILERDAIGIALKTLFPSDSATMLTQLIHDPGSRGTVSPILLLRPLASGRPQYLEVIVTTVSSRTGHPGALILLQDVTARVQAEEERKQTYHSLERKQADILALNEKLKRSMTETHHRVKNNLQILFALIDIQKENYPDGLPITELNRLGANVMALSVIHDILTKEAKEGSLQENVSVKSVLDRLLATVQLTIGERRLRYQCDEVRLAGRQATSLALITNELVSNALKYGTGEVEITLRVQEGHGILEVCDDGSGFPDDFDSHLAASTGLELVENMARWDLRSRLSFENRPQGGARVVLSFPLEVREEVRFE